MKTAIYIGSIFAIAATFALADTVADGMDGKPGQVQGENAVPATSQSLPDFQLSPATITVPTDIQGFVGPINGPTSSYALDCQTFLGSNLVLSIPNTVPTQDSLKALTSNPYRSLLVSLNLNKLGDTPGRILMTAPDSKERMAELIQANGWSAGTQRLMGDKQAIQLLLTIRTGNLVCIFYRLVNQQGEPGRMVLTETLQNVDGLYLLDAQDISAPEILNIVGALMIKGENGVQVQRAPSTGASSASVAPQAAYELKEAALAGDLEKVKALLQDDPNLVFYKDGLGCTALHYAAKKGRREVVEWLIADNADLNGADGSGLTPLHYAARGGYKDIAELLIANKANVNAGDVSGLTPLFYAALMNRKGIAELLLAHNADLNAPGKDSGWNGDTPLYIAACNGNTEVLKVLLAHKPDLSAKGSDGLTPLGIAVANHHDDVADLLRQPAQASTDDIAAALPIEVTPEMEQAFLAKYKAALEQPNPDSCLALIAMDPHMDAKAKESLKGLELLGFVMAASNPNRTYAFVPIPPGQQNKPAEIDGKMYGDYLPAVIALKITVAAPAVSSPNGGFAGATIPLCIQDHQLMLVGIKEIAVTVSAQEKAADNFGLTPNQRKLGTDAEWDHQDDFASLDEFISGLKQPSVEIIASGETDLLYYALCRVSPNLCIYAEGNRQGAGDYEFSIHLTDFHQQEIKSDPAFVHLLQPGIDGTVFKIPSSYSGPLTLAAQYTYDSGKKSASVSKTIDWK